tara:strand:+ start:96045 stop:96986 length:942 start_codon:yes stop_codon:yes gene_type:complete
MGTSKSDGGDNFWLEDPLILVRNLQFFPHAKSTLEETMNALTRIVIVVFLILILLKKKHAVLVLAISLIVISILYYHNKNQPGNGNINEHGDLVLDDDRMMAHAGNNRSDPDEMRSEFLASAPSRRDPKYDTRQPRTTARPPKANPRRPYPAAIPHDYVVQAHQQQDDGYRRNRYEEEQDQSEYLSMLRRRKARLDEAEEIADLEAQLFGVKIDSRRRIEPPVEESDEESEEEPEYASKKFGGIKRFVAANDDGVNQDAEVNNIRLRSRRVHKTKNTTVDPFDLILQKRQHLEKTAQEGATRKHNRRSHYNNT